jgi:hypothetical protein
MQGYRCTGLVQGYVGIGLVQWNRDTSVKL